MKQPLLLLLTDWKKFTKQPRSKVVSKLVINSAQHIICHFVHETFQVIMCTSAKMMNSKNIKQVTQKA